MRKIYTSEDKQKLIDHIIEIAMITHESGIQTAIKLDVTPEILIDLRNRSPRASMISPCYCKDCNPTIEERKRIFDK